MARTVQRLTDAALRKTTFKANTLVADGSGLYLRVGPTLSKAWTFIYIRQKRRTELGLGKYPETTLLAARDKSRAMHDALTRGLDPKVEARREASPTLLALNERYAKEFGHTVTENVAHRWIRLVELHGGPLGITAVDKIETKAVIVQLRKVQAKFPSSAYDLRMHLKTLLDFAKVQGFRQPGSDNVAAWVGNLEHAMAPLGKAVTKHHPSMPYAEVGAFVKHLLGIKKPTMRTNQALAFLIATATRTRETTGARWAEIDWSTSTWTVPAIRMKGMKLKKVEHRVPLSSLALDILKTQLVATGSMRQPSPDDFIFPGRFRDKKTNKARELGHGALGTLMDDLGLDVVPHGFRTSFRAWGGAETSFPPDLLERSLAHIVDNEVGRAYNREDYLEKRRPIMEAWADFLAA